MAIGTREKRYTGKDWMNGQIRAFLSGQGLAKYRFYIVETEEVENGPEMGIQQIA